jgi:hypothetical protein
MRLGMSVRRLINRDEDLSWWRIAVLRGRAIREE